MAQKKELWLFLVIRDMAHTPRAAEATLEVVSRDSETDDEPHSFHSGPYDGLCAHAYVRPTEETGLPDVYGWAVCYERVIRLELQHAELMTKTLKALHRKMETLRNLEGQPADFGQFVNRFARALGAKGVVTRCPRDGHEPLALQSWKLADVPWIVNHRVAEHVKGLRPGLNLTA
jgi:hypothetical protein